MFCLLVSRVVGLCMLRVVLLCCVFLDSTLSGLPLPPHKEHRLPAEALACLRYVDLDLWHTQVGEVG